MHKTTSTLGVAVLLAGLVVVTAPASASAGAAQPDPRPATGVATSTGTATGTLSWGRCRDAGLWAVGAECATLRVPLDHARPGGKQIRIAVSRVRHTSSDARALGPIVVNPGGPGGAGLEYATLGDLLPRKVASRYDWIGFDPRGVGQSRPMVRCQRRYSGFDRPDYTTSTKKSERAWRKRARAYAKSCAQKNGPLLRHLTTEDVARDLDLLRQALGAPRITYYGFSYGTYLGQVYATLFPDHVERMVMDANVDPGKVWYRSNLGQSRAFEHNLRRWFRWVADNHGYYRLGRTKKQVRRAWYRERRALARTPAGGRIGPSEWSDTFLLAGYYTSTWVELADAWAEWKHDGDPGSLRRAYTASASPYDDNGYAVYLAVSCTDAPWPKKWKRWRKDARRLHRSSPFLAWGNTWFNAPCHTWRAPARKPVRVNGNDVPMLLVNERFDAATPYAGALAVRQRFTSSSLVKVKGGLTHAGTLGGNRCVDRAVAAFLTDGTRPARKAGRRADLTCPSSRLPNPRLGY